MRSIQLVTVYFKLIIINILAYHSVGAMRSGGTLATAENRSRSTVRTSIIR